LKKEDYLHRFVGARSSGFQGQNSISLRTVPTQRAMQKKNCGHFHLMVTTHFNINFNGVLYEVARRARRLPPGQWRLQCLGELENHSGAG